MIVDAVKYTYRGTMRAPDGSTFGVQWYEVTDPAAVSFPLVHPYGSGRYNPLHGDFGETGEIWEDYPHVARGTIPARVCSGCYVGWPDWWETGWPLGTPPIVLAADGWPVDCDGGTVGVRSVGLALPPLEFVVSGSPVVDVGVLTGDWADQSANSFLGAPNGAPGQPHFRLLVAADIPALDAAKTTTGIFNVARLGTGSPAAGYYLDGTGAWTPLPAAGAITLTAPTEFSVSGSPLTPPGTLGLAWQSGAAAKVLATPAGASGVPSLRSLVAGDIPNLPSSKITSGTILVAFLGLGTPAAGYYLDGGGSWTLLPSPGAITVTVPGEMAVSGSPLTPPGTLGFTWANQTVGKVFSGPETGSPATPTFRILVASDIPALDASKITTGQFTLAQMPAGSVQGALAHFSGTSAPIGVVPVFSQTLANGVHGSFRFKNTGANNLSYRWTVVDVFSNPQTGANQVVGSGSAVQGNFDNSGGLIGITTAFAPFRTITLELFDTVAGTHTTYDGYISYFGAV